MKDSDWAPYLHWGFRGETVLFPFLVLESYSSFVLASLLTAFLCLTERLVTFAFDSRWDPYGWTRRSRLRKALWRACLYWLANVLRLIYMLVVMTYNLSLIFVMATTLAFAQFVIELYKPPHAPVDDSSLESTLPLLRSPSSMNHSYKLDSFGTRPRSKSRPESIFIHPANSNVARADAAALKLGYGGDTDLVKSNRYSGEAWQAGNGKEMARSLLGHPDGRDAPRAPFKIGDEEDEDADLE